MSSSKTESQIQVATVSGTKIEILTHDNYHSWKPRARALLKSIGKWKYVDLANTEAWNKEKAKETLDEREQKEVEAYDDCLDYLSMMISDEVLQEITQCQAAPEA